MSTSEVVILYFTQDIQPTCSKNMKPLKKNYDYNNMITVCKHLTFLFNFQSVNSTSISYALITSKTCAVERRRVHLLRLISPSLPHPMFSTKSRAQEKSKESQARQLQQWQLVCTVFLLKSLKSDKS